MIASACVATEIDSLEHCANLLGNPYLCIELKKLQVNGGINPSQFLIYLIHRIIKNPVFHDRISWCSILELISKTCMYLL